MSCRGCLSTFFLSVFVLVSGCDNGGGLWDKGVFKSREYYEHRCEAPRENPIGENKYLDVQGTAMFEKMWLRSMSNELYLWNDELEDIDPAPFEVKEYFKLLKVPAPQDKFHWSQPTEQYRQASQSGVYSGYGISWVLLKNKAYESGVAEIEKSANLPEDIKRGDAILGADDIYITDIYAEGVSEDDADRWSKIINNAIFPPTEGETHTIILRDRDTDEEKLVTVTSAKIKYASVPISKIIETDSGPVAYLQFNRHNAVAEGELFKAISDLANDDVTDLILDLRYNGGGYIYIASELAFMIAGQEKTAGQTFVFDNFNNNVGLNDPFTFQPRKPTPFFTVSTENNDENMAKSLPSLNLSRVYVLTSEKTCSASELIMNGLAGVDVEVIQIGTSTCGKPYGFYPMSNCGTTYFTIMSSNDNAKGYGDFYNGFSPNPDDFSAPDVFRGCEVADDFSHDLGDENEAMLSAALLFRATGQCPVVMEVEKHSDEVKQKVIQHQSGRLFIPTSNNNSQKPISIMTSASHESF